MGFRIYRAPNYDLIQIFLVTACAEAAVAGSNEDFRFMVGGESPSFAETGLPDQQCQKMIWARVFYIDYKIFLIYLVESGDQMDFSICAADHPRN